MSQHAQIVILIGSQGADLSRLKINTIGCLPSGSCHRLHSFKPNPDQGCTRVTEPSPVDHMDTTPHAIRPFAITTSHSPDQKIAFTFGYTSFHAQITVSRSKVSLEIINKTDVEPHICICTGGCIFTVVTMHIYCKNVYIYMASYSELFYTVTEREKMQEIQSLHCLSIMMDVPSLVLK